jgi:hypothetical protein
LGWSASTGAKNPLFAFRPIQWPYRVTTVLVILVIFLFLRTLSATIIPSIAVPLSLVGTFGVMYLLGYSLDNLSLMALTIANSGVTGRKLESADQMPYGIDNDGNGEYDTDRNPD